MDGSTLYGNLRVLTFNYSYLIIVLIIGDYGYTNYDYKCRVGLFLFSYSIFF